MTADGQREEIGRRGGRAVAQVLGRTVIVRGLTFAGTVVLARLLSPAEFGTYAIVAAIVGVVALIGDLGLGASLIQQAEPPTLREASTARILQLLVAVVGIGGLWVAAPWIVAAFGGLGTDGEAYLRVLSLTLIPTALRLLPGVLLERELRYAALAAAEVLAQGVFYGVAIGLAIGGASTWSFVAAALAQATAAAALVNVAWRRTAVPQATGHGRSGPVRDRLGIDLAVVRRRGGFAAGFQAANLLAWLRDAVVPLAGGVLASTTVVGHLQFAWRTGQLVSSVEDVVARVALPAFSRLQDDRAALARAIETATLGTAYVIVPSQLWVATMAPTLVPFLFGAAWVPVTVPLQLVCIGSLARFPVRILRQGEFATGSIGRGVRIAAIACLTTWAFVPALLLIAGAPGAGAGFVLAGVATLAVTSRLARAGRLPVARLARLVGLSASAVAAGWAVVTVLPVSPVFALAASGAVTAALVVVLVGRVERDEIARLRRLLRSPATSM